jgi:hypothetical protein
MITHPSDEQLLADVLSTQTWAEIAKKYGYKYSSQLEKRARKLGLPDKVRKRVLGYDAENPSHKRLKQCYADMKRRCYSTNNVMYHRYGGRGIAVCDEWRTSFQDFFLWALANGYADNLTLDRVDTDKDYCPSNCRWADMKTQQRNRSTNHSVTYNGETHTAKEWSEITGVQYDVLLWRLRNWSDLDRVFLSPLRGHGGDNHD